VEVAAPTPEPSEVVFQAVDAGTGAALLDSAMTVRYLVRSPITLDATAVERVASAEPHHISHEISEDRLVVEVRLEAPSYYRLDTVLSVARGGSTRPHTLPLSRRLERTAAAGGPARPAAAPPEPAPAPPRRASPGSPTAAARATLQVGDRAFAAEDWVGAIEAYERLPEPRQSSGEYARLYQRALLRRGVAHINRGEFGNALEVLESATRSEAALPDAFLRLGQAQCAVGRAEEGRGTLAEVARTVGRLDGAESARVTALITYQRGVCRHGEFDRAETTRERIRTGSDAIKELEAFLLSAGEVAPRPAELETAVADAQRRIQLIREVVRGG
jgi:hypothetical protein